MVLSTQTQNNIGGFLPAISRTQSAAPRVLAGRNFRWDFDGVFSGFGNVQTSDQFVGHVDLPYYATFNVQDAVMLFTPNGVYQQEPNYVSADECDKAPWKCVLSLTPYKWPDCADNDYPWTSAFVGDSYFFSHPTVGILKFDTYKCEWSCCNMACAELGEGSEGKFYDFSCMDKTCVATGPVFGITQAANRLVVQSRDTVGWSEIDNGCNLVCDPFCGGGFVSSSVLRYGRPLGVFETAEGFTAFGSNGATRFAAVDSIGAFNAANVTHKSFPINPYAIVSLDNFQIMMFTNKGFYAFDGRQFSPWQTEMGSWLLKLLRKSKLRKNLHALRLFYGEDTDELFVSLIPSFDQYYYANLYTRSLVFAFMSEKWGSFDQPHYFIGPVNANHKLSQINLGFIGWQQSLHLFDYGVDNAIGNGTNVGHLDSFVEIGPFQTQYEQLLSIESEIASLDIHTESRQSSVANLEFEGVGIIGFDNRDNWEIKANTDFNAEVFTRSSQDCYGLEEPFILAEGQNPAMSFVKNYTCSGVGTYHTISIAAFGVSTYYSVKRLGVQLKVIQAKA